MLTGLELTGCQNLAMPAEVMQHVVHVESSYNPFAIGVVGRRLVRQPQNLDEAIATAQMLESHGYNYSVGVAQVNRSNFSKYGLDTYEKAFSACENLAAGSRILAGCYQSANGDWGKSFSCYYSGNFVTGYRDGYVQKIYDSISQNSQPIIKQQHVVAKPIALASTTSHTQTPLQDASTDTGAYRIALRSQVIDKGAVADITTAAISAAPVVSAPEPVVPPPEIFVPQVTGANQSAPSNPQNEASATQTHSNTENETRQGDIDAARVF